MRCPNCGSRRFNSYARIDEYITFGVNDDVINVEYGDSNSYEDREWTCMDCDHTYAYDDLILEEGIEPENPPQPRRRGYPAPPVSITEFRFCITCQRYLDTRSVDSLFGTEHGSHDTRSISGIEFNRIMNKEVIPIII